MARNRVQAGQRRLAVLFTILMVATSCTGVVRVSTGIGGAEPNARSIDVKLSTDGRFAVFASDATNLVPGDNNGTKDIFLRDNQAGTTELISASTGGGPANAVSGQPTISADGNWIVYWSFGSDIVAGDTNGASDVFLYDRQLGTTEIVSLDGSGDLAVGGSLGGSVSDDGNRIAFYSTAQLDVDDDNATHDVYVRDRAQGTTTLVSTAASGGAAGESYEPVLNHAGDQIIWQSTASTIVAGDTNGVSDVFAYSFFAGVTFWVSFNGNGASYVGDIAGSSIVGSVVFSSAASNLVNGDTNGVADIFQWDVNTVITDTTRLTDGDTASYSPTISDDKERVAFASAASNLQEPGAAPLDTNGASDIYIHEGGNNRLATRTTPGGLSDGDSFLPAISADGSSVAYQTDATNLGYGDTNGVRDIVVHQTFEPSVTSITGTVTAGETSLITLNGSFEPGPLPVLYGDGVSALLVGTVTSTTLQLVVTLDASATPGPRFLWINYPAPHLGLPVPVGSGVPTVIDVLAP